MMVIDALKRIFAKGPEVELPPVGPPADVCLHPEDDRISAARMGHPYAFICRRCGHREDV